MNTYIVNFHTDTGVIGYYLVNALCQHRAECLVEEAILTDYTDLNITISNTILTVAIKSCSQEGIILHLIISAGLSAYLIYLANGGSLSETAWLESLKGEQGQPGISVKGDNAILYKLVPTLTAAIEGTVLEDDIEFKIYKIEGSQRTELTWQDILDANITAESIETEVKWSEEFRGIKFDSNTAKAGSYTIRIYKNDLSPAVLLDSFTFLVVNIGILGNSINVLYSPDGVNWSYTWNSNDVYIRFGTELNWGSPIRFVGEKGEPGINGIGQSSCSLSLDNTNDYFVYDSTDNLKSNSIISNISFTEGSSTITNDISYDIISITGCTAIIKNNETSYYVEITGMLPKATSGTVIIRAVYKGTFYTKSINVRKVIGEVKYSLEITPSLLIYNKTKNLYSKDSIIVKIKKEDFIENTVSYIKNVTELNSCNLQLKVNNNILTDSSFKDSNLIISDFNYPTVKEYLIELYNTLNSTIEDIEIISISEVEDGQEHTIEINDNGYWILDGLTTEFKAEGDEGHSPYILDGYWYEWDTENNSYHNTNIKAKGEDGRDGEDGRPGTNGRNGVSFRILNWEDDVIVPYHFYDEHDVTSTISISDIVITSSGKYICKLSYTLEDKTQTPDKDTEHWEPFNEFRNVATDLVLAEKAIIKNLCTSDFECTLWLSGNPEIEGGADTFTKLYMGLEDIPGGNKGYPRIYLLSGYRGIDSGEITIDKETYFGERGIKFTGNNSGYHTEIDEGNINLYHLSTSNLNGMWIHTSTEKKVAHIHLKDMYGGEQNTHINIHGIETTGVLKSLNLHVKASIYTNEEDLGTVKGKTGYIPITNSQCIVVVNGLIVGVVSSDSVDGLDLIGSIEYSTPTYHSPSDDSRKFNNE